MSEPNEKKSNVLAATLVVAIIFQIGLSVLILHELQDVSEAIGGGGAAAALPQGLAPGTRAPEFRLTDTEGNDVSLADFSGRKVMLVFSSDQCRYCKEMYPQLKRLRETGRQPEVELVMLQMDSTPEANRELATVQGFDFPVLVADQETFLAYQVPGTPFSAVVDETGTITATGVVATYQQMASLLGS